MKTLFVAVPAHISMLLHRTLLGHFFPQKIGNASANPEKKHSLCRALFKQHAIWGLQSVPQSAMLHLVVQWSGKGMQGQAF